MDISFRSDAMREIDFLHYWQFQYLKISLLKHALSI